MRYKCPTCGGVIAEQYKGWRVVVHAQLSRKLPFCGLATRLVGKGREAIARGFNAEGRTAEEAERKVKAKIDAENQP